MKSINNGNKHVIVRHNNKLFFTSPASQYKGIDYQGRRFINHRINDRNYITTRNACMLKLEYQKNFFSFT